MQKSILLHKKGIEQVAQLSVYNINIWDKNGKYKDWNGWFINFSSFPMTLNLKKIKCKNKKEAEAKFEEMVKKLQALGWVDVSPFGSKWEKEEED